MSKTARDQGFTLIEILVVIGIIAVLATIVLIAINPARQFAQARNTQRMSNVTAILNAIGQRIADNKGIFESAGNTPCPVLTSSSTDPGSLSNCLVPTYLTAIPEDPKPALGTYRVFLTATSSRITVDAPSAELNEIISVTR